jgi:hypothetical protein
MILMMNFYYNAWLIINHYNDKTHKGYKPRLKKKTSWQNISS